MIQSEFYRIRKSRLFLGCLFGAVFFMLTLAVTFHYDMVRVPIKASIPTVASLNKFTEFLFSDYSLIFPLTLFLGIFFTEDYHKGTHAILLSKGVSRFDLFFGKLTASWIGTSVYLIISLFMAYLFVLFMLMGQPHIEYSVLLIGCYLLLQLLCFLGYTTFIWLLSCLFHHRVIVISVSFLLLGVLYLYLTKISTALNLSYSLYKYWIAGLSHQMEISLYFEQLFPIISTILVYILGPVFVAYPLYLRIDLRKLERR